MIVWNCVFQIWIKVFTQRLLHSKDVSNNQNQNPSQDLVSEPLRVEEKQQEQQLQDLDEVEIIEFTYNSNKAINPCHTFQTPGSVPNQNDLQVSSTETEDSDDYSRDSAEARPASEKPEGLCRPKDSVSCRACSRTFTARRFLFRHVRAHVRDTKQVCGLCGEQFEVAGRLKLHLKTHSKTRKLQIHVRTRSREVRLQQLSDLNKNKETEKPDDSSKTLTKKRPRGRPKNVKLDQNNPAKNNKRKRTI
ncbi:transcription factor Ovo-like 2 isoform X2 [Kryptolebias marmoratus]|uniref:transcription factor Ovo-like 2 isoform X2 n=1 Tax=Kryptolebias marmoratus TaxID=37003 RepID=UPI0007F909BE|nr:transcription factor Ovo-like 2 isoform X2 [Kryptolebias marmoratus]